MLSNSPSTSLGSRAKRGRQRVDTPIVLHGEKAVLRLRLGWLFDLQAHDRSRKRDDISRQTRALLRSHVIRLQP
jgi:hypothetical protein